MRVIATRNSSREGPNFVDYVGSANELSDFIGQADIVVNATPLTPSTTDLFDAAMFGRMKRSAHFINIGRGGSVVTNDLVDALNAQVIAGAGLDVTEPEPLPAGHPLWNAPNVIITPHMASASRAKMERVWAVMLENVRRYVAGEKCCRWWMWNEGIRTKSISASAASPAPRRAGFWVLLLMPCAP